MERARSGRRILGALSRALRAALTALLLAACQPGAAAPAPFSNPLNSLNGPDPWLQFHAGAYYLTATQGSEIKMWRSPTLAGLATAPSTTIWADSDPARCCNVWAPEFHLLDGPSGPRWYVYYSAGSDGTLDNQRMHVLESAGDDPLGPYSYKARIFDPANDGWAIDGSVLRLGGALYYLFSSWVGDEQSLFIAPMSDPWTISGERVLISRPALPWERRSGNVNEGPVALQRGGRTFVVYSASACWGDDYALGMLSYAGGDPLSPAAWAKSPEPVFARSDASGVYAPGHNGFFTSPDGTESWIVYHANSAPGDGCEGRRTTRAQPFAWGADGAPSFGAPLPLGAPIDPPAGERPAAAPLAPAVYYALVGAGGEACLAGGGGGPRMRPCDGSAAQQWRLDYLADGAYRLVGRSSGAALAAPAGPGAAPTLAEPAPGAGQRWRLFPAQGGWLRVEDHSGAALGCGPDGAALRLAPYSSGDGCQQFRLQPAGEVKLVSASSNKLLGVARASPDDGAAVVLWRDAGTPEQRWRLEHAGEGLYRIVAGHSGKCLGAAAGGATVAQAACGDGAGQRWRVEPLNDGTLRLLNGDGARVLDVTGCRMADGTPLQLWGWQDTMCQRFYLAAP